MAIIELTGTGQNLPRDTLSKLSPGDTLRLIGDFGSVNLLPAEGVTVDARPTDPRKAETSARCNGWIVSGKGVTFLGGIFTPRIRESDGAVLGPGLAISNGEDITVDGAAFDRTGLSIRGGARITVKGLRADYSQGLYAEDVDDLTVTGFCVNAAPANAMSLVGVHRGEVSNGSILGNVRGLAHPDGIQGWRNRTTGRDNEDIAIHDNLIAAMSQGIYFTNGAPLRVRIERNRIWLGDYKWAAGLGDSIDCVIADNDLRTLPGFASGGHGLDVRGSVNLTIARNSYNGGPMKTTNIVGAVETEAYVAPALVPDLSGQVADLEAQLAATKSAIADASAMLAKAAE